jgi:hypothetical protein
MIMTLRQWLRIIGAVVAGLGLLCLPSVGRSPQSYGSGFAILSDTSSLIWLAVILIGVGAVVFLFSFAGGEW